MQFETNMPDIIVLHWDGKVIKYDTGAEDDRLCIKGSFPASDHPDQFFAAPCIVDGTGRTMAEALLQTLQTWNVPNSNIVAMSWDTTDV